MLAHTHAHMHTHTHAFTPTHPHMLIRAYIAACVQVASGVENVLRNEGQQLGLQGAASHLVGRIPYFSVNKSLIWDVIQVGHSLSTSPPSQATL